MRIGPLGPSGTISIWKDSGIRREPTANAFEINSNGFKTTGGSSLANSDGRIKEDIQLISGALNTLAKIKPVTFRYSDSYRAKNDTLADERYYKVIAQEFVELFPDAVKGSGEYLECADKTAENEILQVDTYPALITTVAEVQELAAENAILRSDNAELRAQFKSLSERLDQLAAKTGR